MEPTNTVVELQHAPVFAYAMEQSGIPLVQAVRVHNTGLTPLTGAVLEVQLTPDLGPPVRVPVETLPPGEETWLGPIDYRLPAGHMVGLLEAERAQLRWTLKGQDAVLAEGTADVHLLAANEWPGQRAPIGLLASFVLPNHPVVSSILKRVSDRLRQAGAPESLDGYQSKSRTRARALVAALWEAIVALDLRYLVGAASFEATGQKVRLPDQVLGERLGNCLDLTALFAACLEQMGLRPLVVVLKGHACVAVWLVEERFPEGIVEDAARLRTAIGLDQLLVLETTLATQHPPVRFDVACQAGGDHLGDEKFVLALDVRVLRGDGFRPLPLRMTQPVAKPSADEIAPPPDDVRRILLEAEREAAQPKPTSREAPRPLPRIQRWKDRLLDLSLRNRLLNFRPTQRTCLPLDVPDLARFEDLLAGEAAFEVVPRARQESMDQRDGALVRARVDEQERKSRLLTDLQRGTVLAPVDATELKGRVQALERAAREALEDGGASTLYAAIGFLRWFETPASEDPHLAPLLLWPVSLEFDRRTSRVRLRRGPEEPVFNVTLVEKLRRDQQVDLSDAAAVLLDDAGVDVATLLRKTREAIARIPRWEVLDQVSLGIFTFAKFLMWRDLDENAGILLQHEVVRHIAQDDQGWLGRVVAEVPASTLEDAFTPESLPCVLDADSTQAAAVASALAGRSFVLQGPPGTGKSQTITNLIAAAVASGRTVLFVSEKMAALEVVHRRLEAVGLGPYCLELHSHKANKRDVLASIGRALDTVRVGEPEDWNAIVPQSTAVRRQLAGYAGALHRPRPLGRTVWQVLGRLEELRDAPLVRLPARRWSDTTEAQWQAWQTAAETFAAKAAAVEPVAAHPLADVGLSQWSQTIQAQVEDALTAADSALDEVEAAAAPLAEEMWTVPADRLYLHDVMAEIAKILSEGDPCPGALAPRWQADARRLAAHAHVEADRLARVSDLAKRWRSGLHALDLATLHAHVARWVHAFFLLAWLLLWSARRTLRSQALGALPVADDLLRDLATAAQLQAERPQFEQERAWALQAAGSAWSGEAAEAALLARAVDRSNKLRELVAVLDDQAPALAQAVRALCRLELPEARRGRLATLSQNLEEAVDRARRAATAVTEVLKPLRDDTWPSDRAAQQLTTMACTMARWSDQVRQLRPIGQYNQAAEALRSLPFGVLVQRHAQGLLGAGLVQAAFERGLLQAWLDDVRLSEPALDQFEGRQHHANVERFARLDRQLVERTRTWIQARLSARVPLVGTATAPTSELGLVQRERMKKARHLPIRKLLASMPTVLPRVKPCVLMSPMSVAQYLPAGGKPYDLVVFDEASQIGTHEAIGAIARGRQVVIVGDSKQLPPTSFFQRQTTDDDGPQDENDVVELESVLDEAVAKQLPQQMLGWHYRSRHESLIDFSNRHFYDARLQIFPSPAQRVEGLGVCWQHVPEGVYQSGGTGKLARTNPKEAETLVAWLVDRLRTTPVGARTFGVVTFSMAQQSLIADLLDEARGKYPEIEGHFDGLEPVFVKNLENVQGDERDEILFSIGYAKDATGKLRMHFGPLSNAGGERRLNVAITRARSLLRVFSTLTYDQIDLARSHAAGTRALRDFLRFAADSASPAPRHGIGTMGDPLERAVATAVEALGHQICARVGVGSYRVDLAIVDPDQPGRFVLGVELDGPTYGSAATTRDRDRLRESVLRQLGWRLHRIWSADWHQDQGREVVRLQEAIQHALAHRTSAPEPPPRSPEPPPPAPQPQPPPPPPPQAMAIRLPVVAYREAQLSLASDNPEALFAAHQTARLHEQILDVVQVEGPVHKDVLVRRVAEAWSWRKMTARPRDRVEGQLQVLHSLGRLQVRGDFVWPAQVQPTTWTATRGPVDGGAQRPAEHLPPEELANAAHWVLRQNLSLQQEELGRQALRLLGLQNLSKNGSAAWQAGLEVLLRRGHAEIQADRVVVRG